MTSFTDLGRHSPTVSVLGALVLLALTFSSVEASSPAVLDFEFGVSCCPYVNDLDPGYGGFTWDPNLFVTDLGNWSSSYGNTSSFPSGQNAVSNAHGVMTITFHGQPVKVLGASFIGWGLSDAAQSYTSSNVTVEGYLGGSSVGTVSLPLTTTEFQFLDFDFPAPVDEVRLLSDGSGRWWLMDDLAFIEPCGDGVLDAGEECDDGVDNGTTVSCCSSTCEALAAGTQCDDGDACSQTDECDAGGTCIGTNPVSCTALDQCHDPGTCDPSTGVCDDPAKPDGSTCDDGDVCTVNDECEQGACSPGASAILNPLENPAQTLQCIEEPLPLP